MKKNYFLFLLAIVSIFSACRKDDSVFVKPSGAQLSDSYYPVTKNSERTFRVTSPGTPESTYTEIITGVEATFNNAPYYEAVNKMANSTITSTNYYYEENDIYKIRSLSLAYDIIIEFEYLNTNSAVGVSWTRNATSSGDVNDIPARMIGTMAEKNISKEVNGKTFTNVMHSTVQLQYDMGNGYETSATYEFYAAKGIGLILVESHIDMFGFEMTSKTELISYSIK